MQTADWGALLIKEHPNPCLGSEVFAQQGIRTGVGCGGSPALPLSEVGKQWSCLLVHETPCQEGLTGHSADLDRVTP